MKGWVGLVGWSPADGLPTLVATGQLKVELRTGSVCRPKTGVPPTVLRNQSDKCDSFEDTAVRLVSITYVHSEKLEDVGIKLG